MNRTTSDPNGKSFKVFSVCAMALAGFAITRVILRNGVGGGPDEWAYWQGSVNLIEHHSYSMMLKEPIIAWPPFFSIFLALFEMPLSQTGGTLALAMSVIAGLSTAAWGSYVFTVFSGREGAVKSLAGLGSLLFVVAFVPLCSARLTSCALVLFFLGLLFNYIAKLVEPETFWPAFRGPIILGLILSSSILTHNYCLILVLATALVVLLMAEGGWRQRLLGAGLVALIGIAPWVLVRHWLGQEGSHSLSKPIYTFFQYVGQSLDETGIFMTPSSSRLIQAVIGAIILGSALALLIRRPGSQIEKRHRVCLALALTSFAGLFVLFNLVWIDARFGGRYVWFYPLSIIPILFYAAEKNRAILVVLLLLTVGVSGWRTAKLAWEAKMAPLAAGAVAESPDYIHSEYFLTSRPDPSIPKGSIQVKSPVYSWEKLPPEMSEPIGQQPTVILLRSPRK